jgi:hypothetical protein
MQEQGENKMLTKAVLIMAIGLAVGGCTHLASPASDLQALEREELKNEHGHVIGYKQLARDAASGERITRISLFVPRLSASGRVVGYEERVRGGSVLRDLHGRKIGGRFDDVRSRKNVTIVVLPREERVAAAQAPSIDELIRIARLEN